MAIMTVVWSFLPIRGFLIRMLTVGRKGNLTRFHGLLMLVALLQFVICGSATFVLFYYGTVSLSVVPSLVLGLLAGIIAALAQGVLLSAGTGYGTYDGHGARLGSVTFKWFAVALVVGAITCAPFVFVASVAFAHSVKSGTGVNNSLLSVPHVQVVDSDSRFGGSADAALNSLSRKVGSCIFLLGTEGTTDVIYDQRRDQIITIDSEWVSLLSTTRRC